MFRMSGGEKSVDSLKKNRKKQLEVFFCWFDFIRPEYMYNLKSQRESSTLS